MADVVRQLARVEIGDIVRTRRAVQSGEPTHPEGDGVIRARRIAADPKSANHLAARVEWNTTAKSDDSAGDFANPGSLFLEFRIERVGIIQSIERARGEGGRNSAVGRLSK